MSILGAIGGGLSSEAARKGFKNAGNAASAVIDTSKASTVYAPGGADAFSMRQSLLGLGDSAAGQGAYQNYLNSTGYQSALQGGNDAITSSMAAGYGQKGGAADKARLRFGTGLANNYFNNFFSQLGEQSQAGQQADQFASGTKAGIKWDQYAGAGKAKAAGIDSVFGGLGDAAGSVATSGNPMSAIWG